MFESIFLVIIGLFIWIVLPDLLVKKKKGSLRKFLNLSCQLIGALTIVYAMWKMLNIIFE
jgi:hypothetical protein